jgi:hypothetical protein
MATENIIFWLILDPITFVMGSFGAYILIRELYEYETLPVWVEWLSLFKHYWFAFFGLSVSFGFFFYRLFYVLNNR